MEKDLFEDNGIKIHRLPVFLEHRGSNQIILMGLKSKLRELKPDIVHAHGEVNPITLQTVVYCKRLGFKVFVDSHSNNDNFVLNSILKRLYYRFAKIFYTFSGRAGSMLVACYLCL